MERFSQKLKKISIALLASVPSRDGAGFASLGMWAGLVSNEQSVEDEMGSDSRYLV